MTFLVPMKFPMRVLIILFVIAVSASGFAQSGPEYGSTEIQVWTAGGHSVPGGTGRTGIFDAGLRYGWVLSDAHGPAFLKGRFEYAVDAVPVYLTFQRANVAYWVGLTPMNLKSNLVAR